MGYDRRTESKLTRREILKYGLYGGLVPTFWLSGCGKQGRGKRKPNVILIMIDTLRTDRLGCYGSRAGITPEIDKFTRGAVRFEKAFSHAPWTLPSIASLFTSRYPLQHRAGGRLGAFRILSDKAVTIGEVFQRAGITTGAITNVILLTETFGMSQGFDTIDAAVPRDNFLLRRAGSTTQAALRWLEKHNRRQFFFFVHYFDPHLTYDPPQPFRRRLADAKDADSNDFIFGTKRDMFDLRSGQANITLETIVRLEKLYNGEVAYVDYEIGKLLSGISKLGLDENTIVIITSDHGEEFGEHGGFEHGHTLYNELLYVPLIIRVPGLTHPQIKTATASDEDASIQTTVRQIDIAPTLCELAGIASEPAFVGRSLVDLLKGKQEEDRPVLSEGNMWGPSGISWRRDDFKLIQQPSTRSFLLFDINTDPAEQHNLASKMQEICTKMARDLDIVLRTILPPSVVGQTPKLSEEEIQLLRSLGYVK